MTTLKDIKPGANYPSCVTIKEKEIGEIQFLLQSYFVGMYCAVHLNGKCVNQTGDHDNRKFVSGLKRDIAKAIKRGAEVEIGSLRPVQTEM